MKSTSLLALLALAFVGCAELAVVADTEAPASVSSYETVNYKKLQSPTFNKDYNGKGVAFRAQYRGEWTELGVYRGLNTTDRIFINHRDTDYAVAAGPFNATSDGEIPPFILAAPKAKADFLYGLKPGTMVNIKGRAVYRGGSGADFGKFKVEIDEISVAQ